VVENIADVASDVTLGACNISGSPGSTNNTSTNKLMPYQLTEQFTINVQKDDEPSVRFYFVLFCTFIVIVKMICNDFLVVKVICWSYVFNIIQSIRILRNIKDKKIAEKASKSAHR